MENKFLIDLAVKFGLADKHISKIADVLRQLGYGDLEEKASQRAATYLCSQKLYELPIEDAVEEMERKGYKV